MNTHTEVTMSELQRQWRVARESGDEPTRYDVLWNLARRILGAYKFAELEAGIRQAERERIAKAIEAEVAIRDFPGGHATASARIHGLRLAAKIARSGG